MASLSETKKVFDKVFSEYIRKRDAQLGCISCGAKNGWKYSQAGHYISRSHMSVRYDEQNVNLQCMPCNIYKHGNMDEYAIALISKYGKNILFDLHKRKYPTKKWTTKEMESKIKHYQKEIEKLNKKYSY